MVLTYLVLGDHDAPGPALRFPRCAPYLQAMYHARIQAVHAIPDGVEWVTWWDGPPDRYSEAWPEISERLVKRMEQAGAAIGYADETARGVGVVGLNAWSLDAALRDPTIIHHAAIMRASALRSIDWPSGLYNWETLAYHGLAAAGGWIYEPGVAYHWEPSGASQWPQTPRAICNSLLWLQGREGVHVGGER